MTDQLVLIDIAPSGTPDSRTGWELDPDTCRTGRRGVARARQALQAARTASVAGDDLSAAA